jgi:hypothetical protein
MLSENPCGARLCMVGSAGGAVRPRENEEYPPSCAHIRVPGTLQRPRDSDRESCWARRIKPLPRRA